MKDRIITERFIQLPIGMDFRLPNERSQQWVNAFLKDYWTAVKVKDELGVKREAE